MAEVVEEILSRKTQQLAHDFLRKAHDAEIRLATAESCTGGLLAALLTDVEGCGHVFDRGFVTYEAQAKCDLLGLSRELVDRNAAVTEQVALAMAEAALARSQADLAVGITGFAGKCADDQEEGLVFIGCAANGLPTVARECHFGAAGRDVVRREALHAAFEMMDEMLRALIGQRND
nr:nicotinamide-nucleotide amidohydrolase family protein [Porphyrobacter sp. GA68]